MTIAHPLTIEAIILQVDASGAPVRLEYVRGRTKWEASPASRHQITIDRIRASLRPTDAGSACGCHSLSDVLIRFQDPDRSIKRPDVSIFCAQPPESDEALDRIPEAVVEILSLGYEEKDLGDDGAPFYLAQGIRDVLVVDPRANLVFHYRPGQPRARLRSPAEVTLQCGCSIRV